MTAAFGWAAGTVCLKRWPAPGDRVVVTAWQLSIGALCALAGMLLAGESFPLQGWSVRVAGALTFHIVLGTAAAYWLWFVLSERISATTASLTTLAVPVVGRAGRDGVGGRPAGRPGLVGFRAGAGGRGADGAGIGRAAARRA